MPGISSDRQSMISVPDVSPGDITPAVANLQNAFQQGFITADDIFKRTSGNFVAGQALADQQRARGQALQLEPMIQDQQRKELELRGTQLDAAVAQAPLVQQKSIAELENAVANAQSNGEVGSITKGWFDLFQGSKEIPRTEDGKLDRKKAIEQLHLGVLEKKSEKAKLDQLRYAKTPNPAAAAKAQALAASQVKDLALGKQSLEGIQNAKKLVGIKGVVGPGAGSKPVKALNQLGAVFGLRDEEYKNQRELEILISNKVLEGAQLMKGNLSDKDVQFLRDSVPKMSDTPETWTNFLNKWEDLTNQNNAILAAAGAKSDTPGEVTPAAPPAAPAAPDNTPVKVNNPSEAPATAQFIQAPDGRVFKNPNYKAAGTAVAVVP